MKILKQAAAILLITTFVYTPSTNGAGLVALGAQGVGLALLQPLIKPLANKVTERVKDELKPTLQIFSGKKLCKINCSDLQFATCRPITSKRIAKLKVAACKDQCQQKIKVGAGYTLKIRFTAPTDKEAGWSLLSCIETAKKAGIHQFNPDNKRSIAIYGKDHLDFAIDMITEMVVLDTFIVKGGRINEATRKMRPQKLKSLVKAAEVEREELDTSFQAYVQANFGPQ